MAVLTLRVDEETRQDLETYARQRGISVSDALRQGIALVLGHDLGEDRQGVPYSLSTVQRKTLMLLHEGLAASADEEDARWHRQRIEALGRGFSAEYADEFAGVEPEMTPAECGLVWDILDMFHNLTLSTARLDSAELASIDEHAQFLFTFGGFDAGDPREARMLAYCRFLIEDGRWADQASAFDEAHDRGNSHSPRLATYRRMLDAYQPIWQTKVHGRGGGPESYLLDRDELATVAAAWPHPDHARR